MGSSSMGSQWVDGVGMWTGPGGLESKGIGGSSLSSMGMWDEAVKNQSGLRGNSNNNMGLKNSRSSPSLRYTEPELRLVHGPTRPQFGTLEANARLSISSSEQYMMRRKRTEDEEKLLKLLQGMKPQDGFTTWCEQMLHTLNTSANNSSSSLDGRSQSLL